MTVIRQSEISKFMKQKFITPPMGVVLSPIKWSTSYSFKFSFNFKVFGENIELRHVVSDIGIKNFDISKTILSRTFIGI